MSGADGRKGDGTRVVGAGRRKEWTQGIVNPPVWRASTILYDNVAELRANAGRDTHHRLFYGRRGTPTQWSLADALTELEPGAAATFLYPSGVAAVSAALLSVLSPGDELLLADSVYDPTRSFATGFLKRFGVTTRFYDPLIGGGIAGLIGERTRAIFMETPGSLTFEVQDVPAIVAAAKARGVVTLLDNTWATPLLFPAIEKGVDLSILACTKYVVGHSDVMLGSVTATEEHWHQLRATSFQLGQTASPDDAWLGSRGLRTMALRLKHHGEVALEIARWLETRPEVARVLHPALPSCPGHEYFVRDFKGPAGLFTFILRGGNEAARAALIDGLELFGIGYSWGGFESLAIPVDPERIRTVTPWQAEGPAVRLQIGLEDEHHVPHARGTPRGAHQVDPFAVRERRLHAGARDGEPHVRERREAVDEQLLAEGHLGPGGRRKRRLAQVVGRGLGRGGVEVVAAGAVAVEGEAAAEEAAVHRHVGRGVGGAVGLEAERRLAVERLARRPRDHVDAVDLVQRQAIERPAQMALVDVGGSGRAEPLRRQRDPTCRLQRQLVERVVRRHFLRLSSRMASSRPWSVSGYIRPSISVRSISVEAV